ncbi:DUF1161 domain-containing protein [Undibacterium sp.]|uniref:DUF1161 domain-containing protein n=1 Tax=Undibacterium sp. TaxID=1914977 RepID=UPI00273062FA|nr:DUF1161 domain-containing protein [Undibacterium sp.]MDP1976090.1 DUF1161 domain-containing protein [Undibacterium sp.]
MSKSVLVKGLVISFLLSSAPAWAEITSCETIKDKVAAKLERKGVNNYSLQVVSKDTETKYRVVGSCEGGKKKIIYKKEKASSKAEE